MTQNTAKKLLKIPLETNMEIGQNAAENQLGTQLKSAIEMLQKSAPK